MKKWFLVLILLISCSFAWERTWDSMHRESFTDLIQLQDGGFILVGYKGTTLPVYTGIYMTRVDADGNILWSKYDYVFENKDMLNHIVSIDDTTFAVVGQMESAFPDGYPYLYVSMMNINGDTLWTSACDSVLFGHAIDIAADGNILVMDGGDKVFQKYNLSGAGIWDSYFCPYPENFVIGLSDMKAINRDSHYESGYITCGNGTLTTGSAYHAVLARFNSDGDTLWVRHYGNSESDNFGSVISISNPAPGYPEGFLAVGSTRDAVCCTSMYYAIRTDLNGDTLWTHYYSHPLYEWTGLSHGKQGANEVIWAGNETYETEFAIVGITAYPESLGQKYATWLIVISDTLRGDTLWTKTYDRFTDQIPGSIVLCDDGGFAIAGYAEDSALLPYPQIMDLWLLRVDSLGNDLPYAISETTPAKPQAISLSAHPNPFNSSVTIMIETPSLSPPQAGEMPQAEGVRVEIFDLNGRRVAELIPPGPPLTRGEVEKSPLSSGEAEKSHLSRGEAEKSHLSRGEAEKSPLSKGDLGGLVWSPDKSLPSGVYLVRARFGGRGDLAPTGVAAVKRIVYLK